MQKITIYRFLGMIQRLLGRSAHARESWSQEGEDLVLCRMFEGVESGFYVDIGAHHPYRFSNTFLFYTRGWRGINVDASPGTIALFRARRPRDINVESGVAGWTGTQTLHVFDETALNTFDARLAEEREKNTPYRIVDKKVLQCITLAELLDRYLPENQEIDFMSVDVEGLDWEVLRANDWTRFRPRVIVMEMLQSDLSDVVAAEGTAYLAALGYKAHAKTGNSVFFVRD